MIDRKIENKILDGTSIKQGNEPRVAIIILNWNGWRDTLKCLESLQRLTYPNYQVIVVDNGSQDESVERIKAWARENLGKGCVFVKYTSEIALRGGEEDSEEALECAPSKSRMILIRNEENLGFTGGNNIAIHYALQRKYPADYVFLLNNDATVEKDCLTHLVSADQAADAGIVGAVVIDEVGRILFAISGSFTRHFFRGLMGGKLPPKTQDEFWISSVVYGAAMLVRRDVLHAVCKRRGFYLNIYLFAYGDELDFCFVARQAGYKSIVARRAVASHHAGNRLQGRYNPTFFHYYTTRNRILLANSMLPLHWKLLFHSVYFPLSIRRILKMLIQRELYVARAIFCGFVDGYRGITGKWKYHNQEALRYDEGQSSTQKFNLR
jgi:GT2 family glycosyltransferase